MLAVTTYVCLCPLGSFAYAHKFSPLGLPFFFLVLLSAGLLLPEIRRQRGTDRRMFT